MIHPQRELAVTMLKYNAVLMQIVVRDHKSARADYVLIIIINPATSTVTARYHLLESVKASALKTLKLDALF